MPTKVVFSKIALMEAVRAAARVAPTKAGAAFDVASGIIIKIDEPDEDGKVEAQVMATDTTTFFHRYVPVEHFEGDPVTWRVPSVEFSQVLEKARDTTTGKIELMREDGQRTLDVRSGRTRARFSLMRPDDFPKWDIFAPDDFEDVQELGHAIREVVWAADKSAVDWLGGVIIQPKQLFATNRYRIALMPIEFPSCPDEGIILPLSAANTIAELKGDIKVMVEKDGHAAYFMPDDDTQIKTALLGGKGALPPKIFGLSYTHTLEFNPSDAMQLVELTNVINGSKAERATVKKLQLFVGKGALAAFASKDEIGQVRDVIALDGGRADHRRVEIHIDAENFASALKNGGEDGAVVMHYNADMTYVKIGKNQDGAARILKFTKANGYSAWVMPVTG